MVKCKICGRKFKTMQELGGHAANAHPKEGEPVTDGGVPVAVSPAEEPSQEAAEKASTRPPASEAPAEPQPQAPPSEEETGSAEEPSEADQIRLHRQQGLDFKQLVGELGFKPSTVREVIAKEIVAENKEKEEKASFLPLVIKNGKGEMIAPEAVYWQLAAEDGVNGERDFRALMKWAAAIEMVHRMTEIRKGEAEAFAATIKPMLDMMDRSREELDAAAARARDSSLAIAETAAAGAAARAAMHIDDRFNELKQQKPDIATVQDPMKGLMARTMETIWSQMVSRLLGGSAGGKVPATPGLVDKRFEEQGG